MSLKKLIYFTKNSIRVGRLGRESASVCNIEILTVVENLKRLEFGEKARKAMCCEEVHFLAKYTKNELLRRFTSKIFLKGYKSETAIERRKDFQKNRLY